MSWCLSLAGAPNINSVGIGYRVNDGKRTNELTLQFTVGKKVALEAVETEAGIASHPEEKIRGPLNKPFWLNQAVAQVV